MIPSFYIYLILVSALLFSVLYYFAKKYRRSGLRDSDKKGWVVTFLMIVFSVFAFYDTDYFHYELIYELLKRGRITHLEEVYEYIVNYSDYYLLFRLIIWGTSVILLYKTLERFKVNINEAIYIFVSIFLLKFCYSRVSLAMAMEFYGLALLVMPSRNKIVSYVCGILFIGASFFFHKSALFGIAVVLFSLVTIRRSTCMMSLLLFPIVVLIMELFVANVMDINDSEEALVNISTAQNYMSRDSISRGISGIIRIVLERIPYYIAVYIYIMGQMKNIIGKWSYPYRTIANASYIAIYVSSTFLFDLSANTGEIYYRFLYFSMIPTTVFLTICYKKNIYRKLVRCAIAVGLIAEIYIYAYNIYLQSII